MFKYEVLKENILQMAMQNGVGFKLPSFRELSKLFSCSQVTIKTALDELEQEGYIFRVTGKGVFTTSKLDDKHQILALIMPHMNGIQSSQILGGVQVVAEQNSAGILFPRAGANNDNMVETLFKSKVLGCIINPVTEDLTNPNFIELLYKLNQADLKLVSIDFPLPGKSCGAVILNNVGAFEKLAKMLLLKKVKNVAVIGHFPSKVYAERLRGLKLILSNDTIKLTQIDSRAQDLTTLAKLVIDGNFDSIIIADASISSEITYEIRCASKADLSHIVYAGVIEEGKILPWQNGIVLEKPNTLIGKKAAQLIFNNPKEFVMEILDIEIKVNNT